MAIITHFHHKSNAFQKQQSLYLSKGRDNCQRFRARIGTLLLLLPVHSISFHRILILSLQMQPENRWQCCDEVQGTNVTYGLKK